MSRAFDSNSCGGSHAENPERGLCRVVVKARVWKGEKKSYSLTTNGTRDETGTSTPCRRGFWVRDACHYATTTIVLVADRSNFLFFFFLSKGHSRARNSPSRFFNVEALGWSDSYLNNAVGRHSHILYISPLVCAFGASVHADPRLCRYNTLLLL